MVDLLDDLFERAASADEPPELNYIRKHALKLEGQGVDRASARLFSNPAGDYGSLVNERIGNGDWDKEEELGETWQVRGLKRARGSEAASHRTRALVDLLADVFNLVVVIPVVWMVQSRNSFSYGRGKEKGLQRSDVLKELLSTTNRIVQVGRTAHRKAAARGCQCGCCRWLGKKK